MKASAEILTKGSLTNVKSKSTVQGCLNEHI